MCNKLLKVETKTVYNHNELRYLQQVIDSGKTAGDGYYTERCQNWLENTLGSKKTLMTTSCTHALELVFQILKLEDYEVIMPSYNYPSAANSVLLNGGKVVFTEVSQNNLCIDPTKIEEKITPKTKAIIVVHYGGTSCQMDEIMKIANKHQLYVIEDAAQGLLSTYKNKYLGTIGHFGCFSFHQTKNINCGEGGALSINIDDPILINRAEVFRQKGTNRKAFEQGLVSEYEWISEGSSYSPSELLMAFLLAGFENAKHIQLRRSKIYEQYMHHFEKEKYPCIERYSNGNVYGAFNAHIFYLIFQQASHANQFMDELAKENIRAITHFVPLHLSKMGIQMGYKKDDFPFEASLYKRLVRLPINPASDDITILNTIKKIHYVLKRL